MNFYEDRDNLGSRSTEYNARKLNAVTVVLPKGSWVITKLPEHSSVVNATHVRTLNSEKTCLLERKEARQAKEEDMVSIE